MKKDGRRCKKCVNTANTTRLLNLHATNTTGLHDLHAGASGATQDAVRQSALDAFGPGAIPPLKEGAGLTEHSLRLHNGEADLAQTFA